MDISEATPGAMREFSAAEIGALAHLYRGEIYRSTAWRTALITQRTGLWPGSASPCRSPFYVQMPRCCRSC